MAGRGRPRQTAPDPGTAGDTMAVNPRASLELIAENCTSCMLCIRACPVWCLDLDAHLEVTESGGRRRSSLHLDRFRHRLPDVHDVRAVRMCAPSTRCGGPRGYRRRSSSGGPATDGGNPDPAGAVDEQQCAV